MSPRSGPCWEKLWMRFWFPIKTWNITRNRTDIFLYNLRRKQSHLKEESICQVRHFIYKFWNDDDDSNNRPQISEPYHIAAPLLANKFSIVGDNNNNKKNHLINRKLSIKHIYGTFGMLVKMNQLQNLCWYN